VARDGLLFALRIEALDLLDSPYELNRVDNSIAGCWQRVAIGG
jgi:hypothetical protein